MLLTDLLARYRLEREISSDYSYQLGYAVQRFNRFHGRMAEIGEITEERLNEWLLSEQQSEEINDRGRRNVRASILTLLRYAESDLRLDRVRKVKVSPKPPEAWNIDQFVQVANAATRLPGSMVTGVKRSDYFSTVLWFAFETGLRRSDIWRFNIDRLDETNQASLSQHKTKHVHVVQVTDRTRESLHRISNILKANSYKIHRTPLSWPHHWSAFYYWLARARAMAGVDADVINRGPQHIRRTGATAVECDQPETAQHYLGHRSGPNLARASYIDPRKVGRSIMPPVVRHHGTSNPTSDRKSQG